MIEIKELTKYYGERKAVGPLSFFIEAGEVVGLLGLNGAGKTTTLRMLSSDLLPTSGSIVIDGVDMVRDPERVQPRIGYLPDRPPLYPEMRVDEYLGFAAELRGMPRRQVKDRVVEVIDMTALGDVAHDRIDTLSHGFRQRVGIAQAIVHRPTLVLLDEPISGLDPVQIVEMRALVRSLGGEHTVVLSSHILSEISETCDRLLVIRGGEIGASGTESELSSQLSPGQMVRITARVPEAPTGADGHARLEEVLRGLDAVQRVEASWAEEAGEGIVAVVVHTRSDVREALCRALVEAGIGVLGVERSARELESVFLQLTGRGDTPAAGVEERS